MTWKSFHSRGDTLRSVIAAANERRDGVLPTDVEGVAERFHDELDLLAALQLKWHTRLSAKIEQALGLEPMDLREAIAHAWSDTVDELPGVRLVLDRYRADPTSPEMAEAMGRATDKEHMMLATVAGRSSVDDEIAVPVGAELEAHARALHQARTRSRAIEVARRVHDEPERQSLLERLRDAVA